MNRSALGPGRPQRLGLIALRPPQAEPLAIDVYGHGLVGQAFAAQARAAGITLASIRTRTAIVSEIASPAERHVLLDATAPQYSGTAAEAWIAKLEATLRSGCDVVTCNKAPLALAWSRLEAAARTGNATLACSATVGGGTPVLATLRPLARADQLVAIEATLSGTLSFILTRVASGASLRDAVAQAQAAGFAEPDPALDLDGTDAYAKAIILHNALFSGRGLATKPIELASRLAKLELDESAIRRIAGRGLTAQVTAKIVPGRITLDVAGLPGPAPTAGSIEVRATRYDGSIVTVTGPGAGARATASALLSDVRALAAGTPVGVHP